MTGNFPLPNELPADASSGGLSDRDDDAATVQDELETRGLFELNTERTRSSREPIGIDLDVGPDVDDEDAGDNFDEFRDKALAEEDALPHQPEIPEIPDLIDELNQDLEPDQHLELEAEPELEPRLEPGLEPDLDLREIEPELEPEFDPELDPELELELETELEPEFDLSGITPRAQVFLKAIGDRVLVVLPPPLDRLDSVADLTWQEIRQQLSQRLNAGERFWSPEARVTLIVGDRLLDNPQLQDLEETLADHDLGLSRVQTSRRETAIAAVTAGYSVDQQALHPSAVATVSAPPTSIDHTPTPLALAEPLYMRTTVRSGVEVRHPGSVIVFGDVNPGGSILADGDIIIWGKLRGLVHAGANGNAQAIVAALQMEPTQIRITNTVARVTSQNPDRFYPEVAYLTRQGIRISRAEDFPRQAARMGLG